MNNKIVTRQSKQKEEIVEQLKITPIVQIACKKCDIVRSTFYRWLKDDSDFAAQVEAAIDEGTNIINDLAESQLVTSIKDGNMSAIFYWLNHRHNKYSPKLEITAKNGNQELTLEQQELIKQALKYASLNGEQNEPNITKSN